MCSTAVAPNAPDSQIDNPNHDSIARSCEQARLTRQSELDSTSMQDIASETRPSRRASRQAVKILSSLGRSLVLLPHPSDEAACAGLLQRLCEPMVAFVTNDAVEVEDVSSVVASRRGRAVVRQGEAVKALTLAGVHQVEFLSDYPFLDKFCARVLYDVLPLLFASAHTLIRRHKPDTVLVPAYEGGHPDHDVCSFVGAMVRQWLRLPIWEMPLYHELESGELISQRFREPNGTELMYPLTSMELRTRSAMMYCYTSLSDPAAYITGTVEYFRPQRKYDYSLPGCVGKQSVEVWMVPASLPEERRQLPQYAFNSGMPSGAVVRQDGRTKRQSMK
jgi:LmbE family N-acetylglucosaminyl deacetylase